MPQNQALDSVDFTSCIFSDSCAKPREFFTTIIFNKKWEKCEAFRWNHYKLISLENDIMLYDLDTDLEEQFNIATVEHLDIIQTMWTKLREMNPMSYHGGRFSASKQLLTNYIEDCNMDWDCVSSVFEIFGE